MKNQIIDKIFSIVKEEKSKSDSPGFGVLVASLSPLLIMANLHVGLVVMLGGVLWEIKDSSEAKMKAMPDDFLKKLSEEDISKEGLEFLAYKLEEKGFISVYDAMEWMEREEKILNENIEEEKVKEFSTGAEALLKKAMDEGVYVKNETFEAAKKTIAGGISTGIKTGKKVGRMAFREILDISGKVRF